MSKTLDIIKVLEEFAPLDLAVDWDNSGWQINLANDTTKKIMLALSVTEDVVNQAVQQECGLIISHHPLFFDGYKSINANNHNHLPFIKAVQNNIQVYSMHTNLDNTQGGIADTLCDLFGVKDTVEFEEFVRIGELVEKININDFALKVKKVLNAENIKLINPSSIEEVKKVALCPGGGASFVNKLDNIDVYITSDLRYQNAIETKNFAVIDAGHYETERIILPVLKQLLSDFDVEILIADEKRPWVVI